MANKNDIALIGINEAAFRWLTQLGHKVNKQFLDSEMFAHPDFPALTSLIDILDAGNMDYTVRRASIKERNEFNFPCIVNMSLSNGNKGLYLVENRESFETIKEHWAGVILYATKNSKWRHPQNEVQLKTSTRKTIASTCLALCMVVLSSLVAWHSKFSFVFSIWIYSAIVGCLTGVLLLSQELGLSTELVQKVCGMGGSRSGCSNVLNSKHAKGKFGISIATIAFIYFITQWILLIISPYNSFAVLAATAIPQFATLGILVAIWSIYMQKAVIKAWCPLCLGIVSLLVIQYTLSILQNESSFTWNSIAYFVAIFILLLVFLQPIKLLLAKVQRLEAQAMELFKWKRDTYMFLSQWKEQSKIDCSSFENEIELSNSAGLIQITIACNPYCPPCAKAHEALDKLLEQYGEDITVKIRFGVNPDDENGDRTIAVNLILNAIKKYGNAKKVLHDWFGIMDATAFAKLYNLKEIEHNYFILKQQNDWTEAAGVQFTPTIFLNGRALPKRYGLDDIHSMLPEIYNQIENNKI